MPTESLHAEELAPLVAWLDEHLRGATLQGVRMPDRATVVLSARVPGETVHLLVSWAPDLARVHTIPRPPQNPATPPGFQGLLRKEVKGRIAGIRQPGGDRIVHIDVDRGEERIGLVVEMFGRSGDALLLDPEGRIRGAARAQRSGEVYVPPAADPRPAEDRFPGPPQQRDAAVCAHFELAATEHASADRQRRVLTVLRARRKQLRRLAKKQRAEADRASEATTLREEGDLLRGAFGRLKRGLEAIEVDDWYAEGTRTINLDPALEPSEQIDRRYSRARKVERAGVEAGRRLATTESELAEVEAIIELVPDDVDEAIDLLPDHLKKRLSQPPPKRRVQAPRLPYRVHYWNEVEIRVGRGAHDNDDLTFHHARGNDLWLHAAGRPGAHVVVRFREKAPPLELLIEAGRLALKGARVHDGDRAEAVWTRVKNVRKPKGFPPGKVLVTDERALLIDV